MMGNKLYNVGCVNLEKLVTRVKRGRIKLNKKAEVIYAFIDS